MRSLSDCMLKGHALLGKPGLSHGKYFRHTRNDILADPLFCAYIGAGGPKEAGYILKLADVAAPDCVAAHITDSLNRDFPQLFSRIGQHRSLVRSLTSYGIPRAESIHTSVFRFITISSDLMGHNVTEIAADLREAGL